MCVHVSVRGGAQVGALDEDGSGQGQSLWDVQDIGRGGNSGSVPGWDLPSIIIYFSWVSRETREDGHCSPGGTGLLD